MKFDLENLNPGVWVYFDDDPQNGGIKVRHLSGEALNDIEKKTTKKKFEFQRGRRVETSEIDNQLRSDLTVDYCLLDWLIFDKDGEEIPCTKENKLTLINKSPKFMRFYSAALEQVSELEGQEQEEREKN